MWRRPLFAAIERVFPDIDRLRIWSRLDVAAPLAGESLLEARIDARLRPYRPFISAAILGFTLSCVWLVYGAAADAGRHLGGWLSLALPFALGFLVHGLYILVVHEATHGNLYGRRADDWIASVGAGALLLPFTAEVFPHVHRIHHRIANRQGDTNWSPFRDRLFQRSRFLYGLYELVPVVNSLDRLRERTPRDGRRVLAAWIAAAAVVFVLRPPPVHWALVVVGLNTATVLRFWIEHFGEWRGRISNTYWFPFGFGIGNHEVHHKAPTISAVALWLGLWFRRKDVTPLAALRLACSPRYRHFRTYQPDYDGSNA